VVGTVLRGVWQLNRFAPWAHWYPGAPAADPRRFQRPGEPYPRHLARVPAAVAAGRPGRPGAAADPRAGELARRDRPIPGGATLIRLTNAELRQLAPGATLGSPLACAPVAGSNAERASICCVGLGLPAGPVTAEEVRVRKIAVQMYASVDGVMEAPEKWSFAYWTDDHERYAYQRLMAADAILLGRSTYDTFAASWPTRIGDDFADRMNSLPKYVVSSTLGDDLGWNNSRVLRGDVVAEVTKLKQQAGQDILLYGSGQLFNTLLDHHLIDDFRLWVFPLVLGGGKRVFHQGNQPGKLRLTDTTTFGTGVAVLCYQQA
jgi:dihydrofolate reductase